MDSITHIVVGACTGQLIAGKQLGKKAMLFGAIANSIPDLDVIAGLWNSPARQLLVHRGITHSILFAVILSFLLAYIFHRRDKSQLCSFKRWLILFGHGLFLHILLDAFTSYGTGWFEPFNHSRVSFNALFIVDPFFTFPMLTASIVLLILKKTSYGKRIWTARIALLLSAAYLSTSICIKLHINGLIEKDLASKNISYNSYMNTPTPMNNILWYSIVEQKDNFYVGYYSINDSTDSISWEPFTKNDSLLFPYKDKSEAKDLIQFSKNYYRMTNKNGELCFSDMRFGQIGGWAQPQADFVFNFNLKLEKESGLKLQQGRFKSFNSKDFKILIDRINGIQQKPSISDTISNSSK